MTATLNNLIEALRDELKNYGEMLALMDQQQERIVGRSATDILDSIGAIHGQSVAIQNARDHRGRCQRALAQEWGLPEEASFEDLLIQASPDHRPLLRALVDENNQLLLGIQRRARQNHVLLNRSLELMQRFLATLMPTGRTTMYGGDGALFAAELPRRPIYEAVG
jgi:flagellar biosynthesis/type III secretory pathway chaperone